MLDSIYHMTLELLLITFLRENAKSLQYLCEVITDVIT